MSDARKQVSFYGMKPTKSQQRLVQKQIEKWISLNKEAVMLPSESSYHAIIDHERNLPLASCRLEIQMDGKSWVSFDTGKSFQDALFHALKHLRMSPTQEPSPSSIRIQETKGVAWKGRENDQSISL